LANTGNSSGPSPGENVPTGQRPHLGTAFWLPSLPEFHRVIWIGLRTANPNGPQLDFSHSAEKIGSNGGEQRFHPVVSMEGPPAN